ncbi:MAG: DUF423 domain-containing protein [Phyllobacteriaceae bacterium]|nr:DUF423 domain-containing protein [Phyllobacteriaceae bacterium]
MMLQRLLLGFAGLVGALGVAAAASASHATESRNIAAIASICLAHGPALLAVGLAGKTRAWRVAGAILALGTLLFVGDLAIREWTGQGLFPGAAPLGGGGMIVGWLGLALVGLASRSGQQFNKD